MAVALEGGTEGLGIITDMWEEEVEEVEKVEDEEEEEEEVEEEEGEKTVKMAEIHWFLRRHDLPGVMKNLSMEDVS